MLQLKKYVNRLTSFAVNWKSTYTPLLVRRKTAQFERLTFIPDFVCKIKLNMLISVFATTHTHSQSSH